MTEYQMVMDSYNKIINSDEFDEILLEVPFATRSIDMVMINNNKEIISIEFKLKNWSRAIEQARVDTSGADKSYICMPRPKKGFSNKFIEELKNNGIGLFEYISDSDDPLKKIVNAKKNENLWACNLMQIRNFINQIANKEIFALTF